MKRVAKAITKMSAMSLVAASLFTRVSFADECGGVNTYFNWNCNGAIGGEAISKVLITILQWATAGVTVGVLIGIIYGAVMYASAGGNEAQTKKAIGIIRNAIIALLLYAATWSILQYLVPGGVFNG